MARPTNSTWSAPCGRRSSYPSWRDAPHAGGRRHGPGRPGRNDGGAGCPDYQTPKWATACGRAHWRPEPPLRPRRRREHARPSPGVVDLRALVCDNRLLFEEHSAVAASLRRFARRKVRRMRNDVFGACVDAQTSRTEPGSCRCRAASHVFERTDAGRVDDVISGRTDSGRTEDTPSLDAPVWAHL